MELRHLRYFLAAAETENVSRAALILHVSQPALSRQIRDLEEELGIALFDRTGKSVHLTEAGRAFLNETRAVLQRVDEAVAQARSIAAGQGEIQVGYAPSPTVRILPATLRAFQASWPKVRVKLHDLSTEEMLVDLRKGQVQIALMVRPNRAMLRGLQFEELLRDRMCLAVPPTHPLARARSVSVIEAARQPLVVFTRRDYPDYHDYLKRLFAHTKTKPQIAEEHDSAASLITAVESGVGLAILPQSFSCSAGPRLKLIPLSPTPEPLMVGMVWSKTSLTPCTEHFLECARSISKKLNANVQAVS